MKGNLVGLSLSLCIQDVIEGRVGLDQIEKIVSRTRMRDEDSLGRVIADYCENYWSADPDKAERIARALWSLGKIEQPRLVKEGMIPRHTDGPMGHWVEKSVDVVLTEGY